MITFLFNRFDSKMKVAIFGLSANPPTGLLGHQGIVRRLCESELFDEIWILPVYTHMYPEKRDILVPFHHRMEMCKICFENESTIHTKVLVLALEKEAFEEYNNNKPVISYLGTIDILNYIKERNSSIRVTLVLGRDTFEDLLNGKWKESRRLLRENSFYVFDRVAVGGKEGLQHVLNDSIIFEEIIDHIYFDNSTSLGEISSSNLREVAPWNDNANEMTSEFIHIGVLEYIRENKLYSNKIH